MEKNKYAPPHEVPCFGKTNTRPLVIHEKQMLARSRLHQRGRMAGQEPVPNRKELLHTDSDERQARKTHVLRKRTWHIQRTPSQT